MGCNSSNLFRWHTAHACTKICTMARVWGMWKSALSRCKVLCTPSCPLPWAKERTSCRLAEDTGTQTYPSKRSCHWNSKASLIGRLLSAGAMTQMLCRLLPLAASHRREQSEAPTAPKDSHLRLPCYGDREHLRQCSVFPAWFQRENHSPKFC